MNLLTSKSIIYCEENEEEQHYKELMDLENKLYELEDYNCLIIQKNQDVYHKDQPSKMFEYNLHSVYTLAEFVDCKNGADAFIDDNGQLVLSVYGQSYTYQGENYLLNSTFCIIPHNEDGNILDISDFLLNNGTIKLSSKTINDIEKNKSKESTLELLKYYKSNIGTNNQQQVQNKKDQEMNR